MKIMKSSTNEGNHSVYAEYFINGQLYTTESKNYSVVNPETKLLLEDFTGTWCGYCPPVKYAIEQALEIYPKKSLLLQPIKMINLQLVKKN